MTFWLVEFNFGMCNNNYPIMKIEINTLLTVII